jgi:8-oxo-dGTP diphosphatase
LSLVTLEGGEVANEVVARKAKEEAGIDIEPGELKFVHVAHRRNPDQKNQERTDLFYEAREWQGQITNAEPEKCDDLSWFKVTQLPDNITPFIALVLEDIENGVNYSEYAVEPI